MKIAANIAGGILGFLFAALASVFFAIFVFHVMDKPKEEDPTPLVLAFQTAFMTTGYMVFVKIFEIVGGILVAIPKTRNLGLLVLGPIIINILCYHAFVAQGKDLFNPILIVICLLALFLLWCGRKAFAGLLN